MIRLAGIPLNEAAGKRLKLFRIGKNPKNLANRNVADAEGLSYFMTGSDEEIAGNKIITLYEITFLKQPNSPYEYYTGASQTTATHTPDPDGEAAGRNFVSQVGGTYYSLPANGAWDFKIVKSIPVSRINKQVEKLTGNPSFAKQMKYSPERRWEREKEMSLRHTWATPPPPDPEPFRSIAEEDMDFSDRVMLIRKVFGA